MNKISDAYGSKGIIVDVWEDEEMPVTADGVRADVIMDPSSLPSRSNVGRVYEQYIAASSRKAQQIIRAEKDDKKAWNHVMSFLEAFGGEQKDWYAQATDQDKYEILKQIREKEFYLHYRASSDRRAWEIVNDIEKTIYKPVVDYVYFNYRGEVRKTKHKAMIGPIYTILLSKLPEDFLITCSAPRFNHYMIAVGSSTTQKLSSHISRNPLKIFGETENRMVASVAGPQALIELQDRNCSVETLKHLVETFLTAEHPGFCENLVDREKHKFGGNSALNLMKHVLEVGGVGIKYVPDPNYKFDETMIPGIGLKDRKLGVVKSPRSKRA